MKLIYNKFEMLDHSGKILVETFDEEEILANAGRDGDLIRKTRGTETTINYKWDTGANTWKITQ
jgi:hypothetical protein